MKRSVRLPVVGVCLSLAVVCAGGCGKKAEEDIGGTPIELPIEQEGEAKIGGESADTTGERETRVQLSEGVVLPEDFPEDAPLYTGATVMKAASLSDGETFTVALHTTDPFDQVVTFYKDKCPAEGWEQTTDLTSPGATPVQILAYTKGDRKLSLNIVDNQSEGARLIALMVGAQ